jgi:4-amino-4-deoxy-L-arabinose transferase-like glycosyltransferase
MKLGKYTIPWLALILALCFVARMGVLLAFPSVFAFEQTGEVHGSIAYDAYARNLLDTGVYGLTAGTPDAAIPPLYSYALAVVYAIFGRGHIQVGLFHTLLDMLSVAMLYLIGKHLLPRGRAVGLLAGLCYALYPYLIFQNLTLIDTPLFMALMYAFLLAVVLLRERAKLDRGTWLLAGFGGVALGLAVLTRPVIAPLAPLAALWFLFRLDLKQAFLRLLPVAAICLLLLAPWIAYTYRVYGVFVPVATNGGMNFWFGNNKYTIPLVQAGYHPQWITPDEPLNAKDTREASDSLYAISFRYLREHSDQIPKLLWVKFVAYWSIDVYPSKNPVSGAKSVVIDANGQIDMNSLAQGDPVSAYSTPLFDQIGRVVHQLYYGALFLLALVGLVLTARQWRNVSLLWFVQLAMTAFYVIYIPATRYRVPTDPLLFLFSAYTLVVGWLALQRAIRKQSAA